MPNEEWERLQEALRKAPTPEARKEAAEAFRRYRIVRLAKQRGSKPTLVSLGFRKPYPTSIPVDKIPDELERNPQFFEFLSEVITESESK